MKKLLTITGMASIGMVLVLFTACQTTSTATIQKETLLSQSGFKTIAVTTPQQQKAVSGLTQGRVTAVKHNGKTYYVYPTAAKDKIYVGKQQHFNTYKQNLMAQQGQAQMAGQSLEPTMETAGPNHIEVQQFGGFGPMGVNALGDW